MGRRGEHCSPAAINGNVRFHGSIWNAPLREPKRPPCVKGAGCAAAQTEGLRPYGYNPTRPYTLQSLRHGLRRATRLRVGPLCRCATSPHTVGSHPLHKGGFAVGRRGEHCSPAAISGNVRFHGSIWNAPLRRRGGFYIRPYNLGQRRTSRASTARPYNALFRQSGLPSRGAQRCVHPLAPSARGLRPQAVGERVVRLSEIFRAMARFSPSAPSGHRSPSGASATSPVSGESVSQREAFRHAGLPFEGSSRAAGEGWPGSHESPHHPPQAPIKTTKRKTEECLRHSSIFCSYFALHTAIELVAIAQQICAN